MEKEPFNAVIAADLMESAFSAGFKDCKGKVEEILMRAMSWPIPKKFTTPAVRRRYIVFAIQRELEKLNP